MDRIDPAVTTSLAQQPTGTASTGLGSTFRALAQGTSTERRRRSLRGSHRPGRALAADATTTDSGTWRLAL